MVRTKLRGPGWKPTPLDRRDEATELEVNTYYIPSQDPVYVSWVQEWMQGLPTLYAGIGPHAVPIIEEVLDLVKPRNVLEIGFGSGGSASMFLNLDPALTLTSVDIRPMAEIGVNVETMRKRFPGRFIFYSADSRSLRPELPILIDRFQLISIDGGHDYDCVAADTRLGKELGIPWFLFDDWWPIYGPGVQPAIRDIGGLTPAGAWGNMRLFRNDEVA